MVMHDSQARPPLAALISCSGVEKSPGSPLRLFTMMSGCSSDTILFIYSDSHPAAPSGQSTAYHSRTTAAHQGTIKSHAQPSPADGCHEHLHQVAAGGLFGRAIVGVLGVEQAE